MDWARYRIRWGLLVILCVAAGPTFVFAQGGETGRIADMPVILFFGDSITAGFGVEESEAFPALVQRKIDRERWKLRVVNGGLSGETTAGGLRRIDWMLKNRVDVFVLELGGNDALRGIDLRETRKNLQGIVDQVRARYPRARLVIAGMQAPPNLGPSYTAQFKKMFSELAQQNRAVLIPFILEKVGGVPRLNLPDGIHPTPEGHRSVAETVWTVLKPVLSEVNGKR